MGDLIGAAIGTPITHHPAEARAQLLRKGPRCRSHANETLATTSPGFRISLAQDVHPPAASPGKNGL
jgi:hypothetical protein